MYFRYDLFQNAFEHVSTIIDDIYKVHTGNHLGLKLRFTHNAVCLTETVQ